MAARTFTTAGVNNLWSNPANWDGGATIPQEDDSVTIPAGQTCEYDYNSAYTTGIAGITITGTLKLTRSAGTYRLFMKAATTIAGAGTFDCGASALDAIPFAAKHTITGGAAWYINGTAGLTMTVYAAEPSIKTILLSGDEAIGQTELSVDTNVTGDIWAEGDTIRIDDINKAVESEERVIAAGGLAAGAITITAGLTAAKSTGAVVSLMTRNVKFIGAGAAGFVAQNFTSGKLTIAGGQWYTAAYRIFSACPGISISGGTFGSSAYVLFSGNAPSISGGVFSGNTRLFNSITNAAITGGSFTGNTTVFDSCTSVSISAGIFKGNNTVLNGGISHVISGGTFHGNNVPISAAVGAIISGGSFTGNTSGVLSSSAKITNASFSNNTQDINMSVVTCYNTTLGSTTENAGYTSPSRDTYSESIDHDQVAGAFKSWTRGGVTTLQTSVKPTGYSNSMQTVLENAAVEGYWQKEVTVNAGASVNITMNLRKDASMAYLPRVIVFNKASADPFAGGTGLHTFTMTDSVDTWEDDLYTYTNTGSEDVTLVIRCQGMNATGNMFSALSIEKINVDLTTTIALITAVKAKTDQLAFTVTNQVDANALTGGGGATAEAVRIEMDANSTQLAAIVEDTGTTLPAALGSITGAALSAAGVDAILDEVIVGSYTLRQLVKVMASKMAGKATGGGTTSITYRGVDDTSNVIVETVDANGNRSAVTLTV